MGTLCALRLHKWGKWRFGFPYIDTSYKQEVRSTALVRLCGRCGLAQEKRIYGGDPAMYRRLYGGDDE